ncbi:hypothetical protein FQN54_008344 [Arachnomyces sp. PD_36]|nr:hypothetical protein FQN54_008344 [Arachnomyces sp. PD_36]
MSGAGDDRWRSGRGYDQNHQRHSTGGPPRSMQGRSGNHYGQGQNMNSNAWGSRPGEAGAPTQEQHIPVSGFNGSESKDALRRVYQASGPGESKPAVYKATGKDANNARSSGPWASKPNTMVNGKDFFLELRKQVSASHQGTAVPGG